MILRRRTQTRPAEEIRTTYVTQWFPPEPAQISDGIARSLKERGHDVTVLTGIPNYPTGIVPEGFRAWRSSLTDLDGIHVRRAPLYPSHDSSAIKRMVNYVSWAVSATLYGRRVLRQADVAIVYSGPATAALPVMVWHRLCRTPYVLMIQDLWPDSVLATGFLTRGIPRRLASTTLTWFCRWAYRSAAHVIAISPGAVQMLVERGVDREKISLVYNWAQESIASSTADVRDARTLLGVPVGAFVVSYAGNHGAAQGLDVVLRAAARLNEHPDITFLFVGDGMEAEHLRDLCKSLGCRNVVFHGPVSHENMSFVQAASDIQLICLTADPLFRITMPSKVQSILASGTASIAVAEGDAARVVEESGAGWSVAPGDDATLAAVIQAAHAEGNDAMSARGEAGRAYYRRYMSQDVGASRLDQILRRAAGRPTKPAQKAGISS